MAADLKLKYPSSSSVALTIGLASLADDNANKVTGREGDAVDNTSALDIDHLVSGYLTTGTSPTAGGTIEIWALAPVSMASGTPTWPDVFDGTDSAETVTSRNVLMSMCQLICSITVDSASNRTYPFRVVSMASLFGGALPPYWVPFVVNATGVALHATSGNHAINYYRVQGQSV